MIPRDPRVNICFYTAQYEMAKLWQFQSLAYIFLPGDVIERDT